MSRNAIRAGGQTPGNSEQQLATGVSAADDQQIQQRPEITIEDIGTGQVLLTLDGSSWRLPAQELPGGLAQAEEMQRLRQAALQQHEPWCAQDRHARSAKAALEPVPECESREWVITLSGREYGSFWHQEPDGETYLFAEWPGGLNVELSVADVRALFRVALSFGGSRDVDQVTNLFGDALDEYEGGDAWRDRR